MTGRRRGRMWRMQRALRRVALVAVGVLVMVPATGVLAHDPIILADSQTSPALGPLLPDGTISFALYGVLTSPGDSRGFRVQFADGDRLELSLLVPALEPEQSLTDDQLPTVVLTAPDGSVRLLTATGRVRFDEPFSNTSYLRLLELAEPAQAGVYAVVVDGTRPARFTVSVGSVEQFGTPVENAVDREGAAQGLQRWYATPPPEPAVAPAVDAQSSPTSSASTTLPPTADATDAGASATSTSGPVDPGLTVAAAATSDGAAGTAVFFGVMAVIVVVGLVLYARRGRRFGPPDPE